MEDIISVSIFLLIIASVLAFITWRKLKDVENLKEWVAWSVCESDGVRGNMPLWAHLKSVQILANIRDEYRITEEEWESAKDIIIRYQKNLWKAYFDGRLWAMKSIYGISGEDYFVFMLYAYLCEHQVYGYNVVFHKMQYITYMYCKQSLALQKNVPSWNEGCLKAMLDDDLSKQEEIN